MRCRLVFSVTTKGILLVTHEPRHSAIAPAPSRVRSRSATSRIGSCRAGFVAHPGLAQHRTGLWPEGEGGRRRNGCMAAKSNCPGSGGGVATPGPRLASPGLFKGAVIPLCLSQMALYTHARIDPLGCKRPGNSAKPLSPCSDCEHRRAVRESTYFTYL